ncbi:hypothetical protein Abu_1308 [Aliarcobacter butzleri RM4018]|uniref:Uncharacterized protein n=1 Tax=Aliarcobacter butzleri (strain RM4018) TaxID=367737 RepID=A8EUE1_ALIB4|nr:hypothetical protein Abu_1308 [Aliarcobacter butzleri RM4018]
MLQVGFTKPKRLLNLLVSSYLTVSPSPKKLAVYSLLHYPLDYSSHYLNGTTLHCSPDFPLEISSYCLVYLSWNYSLNSLKSIFL